MEALIPMNKFMELTEKELMVVDGGGALEDFRGAVEKYTFWAIVIYETGKGFIDGFKSAASHDNNSVNHNLYSGWAYVG
ncbi:hypothetical protein [Thermoanaerobacter uzonensis]|uniref:hypothetical protein n=1 Tax=Thermoanaerobacter uzonensis TaxID=447593 RepID=UPI003D766C33